MDEDHSALPPGTLLDGKFRVVRSLGVGGMGAVYEIEHELTKHRRALKLLHAVMAQNPGVVERFLREASAAGRVGNPHIVESFDAGTLATGEPYLVLEMLRGETLTSRLERGPMSVGEVVDLVGQACDGIQAAHEAGIVHRDLKPDNLFIVEVEGRPFVKILDFGISKFDPGKIDGRALTQEGAALGTPYYMSAEQIRGELTINARTDVYALGVILYECLAGFRPYDAETLTQLAILIHTGQPKPLSVIRPDLPPAFAGVVERAMAADSALRTPTAIQLREELEQYGAVSFAGRTSMPSALPSRLPPPTVPAQSVPLTRPGTGLATSAAGISMSPAQKKAQSAAPVFVGFGVLALAAIGALVFLRSGGSTAASAEPASSGASVANGAAPTAPLVAPAPPPPPAPSAVTSANVPPLPASGSPQVAPTLQQQVAPPPAAPLVNRAPGTPSPATAEHHPRRTEEKGLAKDNPFR